MISSGVRSGKDTALSAFRAIDDHDPEVEPMLHAPVTEGKTQVITQMAMNVPQGGITPRLLSGQPRSVLPTRGH